MAEERDPNERPPILSAATQELLANVLKDPEGGKDFMRMLKKHNPKASIPVVELDDRIEAIREESNKKIGALENTISKLQTEQGIKEQRGYLVSKGLDAKQIEEVEKLMLERKIPDYEAGLDLYTYRRQLAQPTPHITPRKPITDGMPKEISEALAQGNTGPLNQHALAVAHQAVSEIQQQKANAR